MPHLNSHFCTMTSFYAPAQIIMKFTRPTNNGTVALSINLFLTMKQFSEITPQQAWEMMNEQQAVLVDIRDLPRFTYSHPQNAFHLTNQNYGEFQQRYDFNHPIIVSCYHGISSRNIAAFLVEQGYKNVYSLIGGFDGWMRAELPIEVAYLSEPETN
ncbi:rhodanese domain-containing protein [Actinobacillus seminis]|uniref:Thiosulfate sulfurtransferase GlpE n=2 Tax=Actinobacillus seminis TaxID=722 RepID=A0A380VAG6_9PAST|nr:rhodanese domain-containing protein [Actinobacillus seminis]